MDTTESLENHQASIFDKIVQNGDQEEVVQEDIAALSKFLLSGVEIEVDVKMFNEFGNGIAIRIRFLLNNFHQIFQHSAAILLVDDDGSRQVPKNVRAHGFNSIQVPIFEM